MSSNGDNLNNEKKSELSGLAFVGTEPGSGKTVLMTGLAGVLSDYGANIRAIKPLGIGSHKKDSPELSFMSIISKSPQDYPLFNLKYPPSLSSSEWAELLLAVTKSDIFTFIEMPGGCATPVNFLKDDSGSFTHSWKSVGDLINELNLECVVVAGHTIDVLEKLELSISYLRAQKLKINSIVTVEHNQEEASALDERMFAHDFELIIQTRYAIPYLGKLKYSPVISVPKVRQGNLKKSIEADLDLLAFRKMVDLPIC